MPSIFPFQLGAATVLDNERIGYGGQVWRPLNLAGNWCLTLSGPPFRIPEPRQVWMRDADDGEVHLEPTPRLFGVCWLPWHGRIPSPAEVRRETVRRRARKRT